MSGQVYFLANAGRIKIGTTTNLKSRMRDIGAHLVGELVLVGVIDGDAHVEQAIHKIVAAHRLKGEWFTDCAEVRDVIADVMARGMDAISHVYSPPRLKAPAPVPAPKPPFIRDEFDPEDDPLVKGTNRLLHLAHHPVMHQLRIISATAKKLKVDPVPAMIPVLRRIPHEDKKTAHKNAYRAISKAEKKLTKISQTQLIALFQSEDMAATWNTDRPAIAGLVEVIVNDAEREVIHWLGPMPPDPERDYGDDTWALDVTSAFAAIKEARR